MSLLRSQRLRLDREKTSRGGRRLVSLTRPQDDDASMTLVHASRRGGSCASRGLGDLAGIMALLDGGVGGDRSQHCDKNTVLYSLVCCIEFETLRCTLRALLIFVFLWPIKV